MALLTLMTLMIGGGLAAGALSSSSSSSGSSRRTETDHEAIKAQRAEEEKKRLQRMRQDIAKDVSQALQSLGCDKTLTAADTGVLTDTVLLKPAAKQPGEQLMQQLNRHKLGSKKQRQLLAHLMAKKPEKVTRLPVLEQALSPLDGTARIWAQLEQLKAQLAEIGQINR